MKDSHTRLREQWDKITNEKHWGACFECCDFEEMTKFTSDWWLSHFSTELESIRREVEEMQKGHKQDCYFLQDGSYLNRHCDCGAIIFNEAITDIKSLLSNRIQK